MSEVGHRISFHIFENGERYPVLSGDDGPLWYPTLFGTSQRRNDSVAPNTTRNTLTAVKATLAWAAWQGCDLEERFRRRDYLRQFEIDSLVDFLGRSSARNEGQKAKALNVTKLRKPEVGSAHKRNLILYAAIYIDWLTVTLADEERIRLTTEQERDRDDMVSRIRAKAPPAHASSRRTALTKDQQAHIEKILQPDHPENPFTQSVRKRNYLIFHLGNEYGVRGGELLSVRVNDVNFRDLTLRIERRHNDKDDPRRHQPVVKTLSRVLPIFEETADLIMDYIRTDRREAPQARFTPYLIVNHSSQKSVSGTPLAQVSLRKVYSVISDACAFPKRVNSHTARHNSATNYAEELERLGYSDARQQEMLSYKYGWAPGSGTSSIYTTAKTEKDVFDTQKKLQKSVIRDK